MDSDHPTDEHIANIAEQQARLVFVQEMRPIYQSLELLRASVDDIKHMTELSAQSGGHKVAVLEQRVDSQQRTLTRLLWTVLTPTIGLAVTGLGAAAVWVIRAMGAQ